jgi:xanthomonalisin
VIVYNGGQYIFGGTSVAAPTLAGEIALVDQNRATPLSSNNLTNRSEYSAAVGALYGSNYRDITTGSNGYHAGTGYDLATGLGAPLANSLVAWLNAH